MHYETVTFTASAKAANFKQCNSAIQGCLWYLRGIVLNLPLIGDKEALSPLTATIRHDSGKENYCLPGLNSFFVYATLHPNQCQRESTAL